jgi:hypothetical protein
MERLIAGAGRIVGAKSQATADVLSRDEDQENPTKCPIKYHMKLRVP